MADMQEAKRKLAEKVHGSSSSSSDPSYKDMLYPVLAEKRQVTSVNAPLKFFIIIIRNCLTL